jgi:hypothetical protein
MKLQNLIVGSTKEEKYINQLRGYKVIKMRALVNEN